MFRNNFNVSVLRPATIADDGDVEREANEEDNLEIVLSLEQLSSSSSKSGTGNLLGSGELRKALEAKCCVSVDGDCLD